MSETSLDNFLACRTRSVDNIFSIIKSAVLVDIAYSRIIVFYLNDLLSIRRTYLSGLLAFLLLLARTSSCGYQQLDLVEKQHFLC